MYVLPCGGFSVNTFMATTPSRSWRFSVCSVACPAGRQPAHQLGAQVLDKLVATGQILPSRWRSVAVHHHHHYHPPGSLTVGRASGRLRNGA